MNYAILTAQSWTLLLDKARHFYGYLYLTDTDGIDQKIPLKTTMSETEANLRNSDDPSFIWIPGMKTEAFSDPEALISAAVEFVSQQQYSHILKIVNLSGETLWEKYPEQEELC